jgi:hypothetical protein
MLDFIVIVSRTFDMGLDIYIRIKLFFSIALTDEVYEISYFVRYVAFFLLIAAHGLDGVVYYLYDKNFRILFGKKGDGAK